VVENDIWEVVEDADDVDDADKDADDSHSINGSKNNRMN
jgi:hypothetical protein